MKKYVLLSLCLVGLFSCSSPESENTDSTIVNHNSDNQQDKSLFVHDNTQGEIISEYMDSINQQLYVWVSQISPAKNAGYMMLTCWDMSESPMQKWQYRDSMICEKGMVTYRADLDAIEILNLSVDEGYNIIIVYTEGCSNDNKKNQMNLVVLNPAGKIIAEFFGFPISYVPSDGLDSMDLRYSTSLGRGKHAEGKIENFYEFDNFSPTDRKAIQRVWRKALKHNLGIRDSVSASPSQHSIE